MTVRHLAETIGLRRSATPDERLAAEYLGGLLQANGFTVTLQSVPFTGTRNVARITAPTATLPGGPNWQLSVSNSGRLTGPDAPVVAEVVYAGTGATAADFPAGTAGKIVLLDQGANTAARNTQVANAVAAGAAAVIVGATANNASPPTVTVTPAQPTIPIVGGGRAHLDWIKGLLAAGPLTLGLATHNNVNYPRTNVIGVRKAVGDPTGTKAPIVMVGAHIDTVLGAPGADDDGSGNGVAQEIARVISQYPLDKEIRIGGWAGEEDGYIGSQAYLASLPAAEKARFVGEWQMDMVGSPYPDAAVGADARRQVQPRSPTACTRPPAARRSPASTTASSAAVRPPGVLRRRHPVGGDQLDQLPDADDRLHRHPARATSRPSRSTTSRPTRWPTSTRAAMQTMLSLVGGAVMHAALNQVDLIHEAGIPSRRGRHRRLRRRCPHPRRDRRRGQAAVVVPHATCTFAVGNASATASQVSGERRLALAADRRGRLGAGDAGADAGCVGHLRHVRARRHEDLHGVDDGQRDLDRRRRDADGQPTRAHNRATWSTARSPCRSRCRPGGLAQPARLGHVGRPRR